MFSCPPNFFRNFFSQSRLMLFQKSRFLVGEVLHMWKWHIFRLLEVSIWPLGLLGITKPRETDSRVISLFTKKIWKCKTWKRWIYGRFCPNSGDLSVVHAYSRSWAHFMLATYTNCLASPKSRGPELEQVRLFNFAPGRYNSNGPSEWDSFSCEWASSNGAKYNTAMKG